MPVRRRVTAAFVPLVDCAVLVAARERGFAAAHGIELELFKEPSWASLRDHLNLGYVDCAHALAPLPIASTLGVAHVAVECAVPFVLGRGGNAITVSAALFAEMCAVAGDAPPRTPRAAGRALAAAARRRSVPLTLGMVFPFSSHNFDLRYWLAAAGLHPDSDLRLVAIPPPLMVESLRAGQIDGFCVGEPWNSVAVDAGLGQIVATKSALHPHGVEKVLALRAAAADELDWLGPLLAALLDAARWADEPAHHAELAALLARPEYVGAPAELVARALGGRLELGGGERSDDPDFLYFARGAASVPRAEEALWIYAQMLRWGQLEASAAHEAAARRVFRTDLCERLTGLSAPSAHIDAPFDGVELVADDLAAYVAAFDVRTPYVAARAGARDV
jgi:ABC-type nitrate/sulfonate/bicarbonate transport system substrate-binding protein